MAATSPTNIDPEDTKSARGGRRRNNLQHGLRGVTLGGIPKGANVVGRLIQQLRTQLEAAVIAAKSEISLTDASGGGFIPSGHAGTPKHSVWQQNVTGSLSCEKYLLVNCDEYAKIGENRQPVLCSVG